MSSQNPEVDDAPTPTTDDQQKEEEAWLAPQADDLLIRDQAELLAETQDNWDLNFEQNPEKKRPRLRFTAQIGVLKHYVEVVPIRYVPDGGSAGWLVRWGDEARSTDQQVAEVPTTDDALVAAQNQMRNLE